MSAAWHPDDLDDLRAVLRADPGGFAMDLLGKPTPSSTRRELRFGSRAGSLIVKLTGPYRATWRDHQALVGGDLFYLVMHDRGCTFPLPRCRSPQPIWSPLFSDYPRVNGGRSCSTTTEAIR